VPVALDETAHLVNSRSSVTVTPDAEGYFEAVLWAGAHLLFQREIATLEKKMRAEPQLNRKIELRKQIRQRTAVLDELNTPTLNNKE
jgi:hypothetical protein